MPDTDVTYTRAVQLKRAGFHRRGSGWARGSLVISDATVAAMSADEWAARLKRWRQGRD
jgi:hypothetical protein